MTFRRTPPGAIFFTVDTVTLRRLYVLSFLSIGSRQIQYVAYTNQPNTTRVLQQARNLLMELDDHEQRGSCSMIATPSSRAPSTLSSTMRASR